MFSLPRGDFGRELNVNLQTETCCLSTLLYVSRLILLAKSRILAS